MRKQCNQALQRHLSRETDVNHKKLQSEEWMSLPVLSVTATLTCSVSSATGTLILYSIRASIIRINQ
jgi:hypothetical protein